MGRFAYTAAQKRALAVLSGAAHHVMLFGGSRSGKSFLLCCALLLRALRAPGSRHAVIRRYGNAVQNSIGSDTIPKVLKLRFGGKLPCEYRRSDSVFLLPNQAEIWLIGLDDDLRADKILGKEFATLYFNECSELDFNSVQIALTRLAQKAEPLVNRAFYDCNPPGKGHWSYQLFIRKLNPVEHLPLAHPGDYAALKLNPQDNSGNLPPGYIENTLAGLPRNQRERFLDGNFSDDAEGGLWSRAMIDAARIAVAPELQRIVIGVDPAVTSHRESDCTGIVAAAAGSDGNYYVLADRSMKGTPLEWGRRVAALYHELQADRVIGEINNGGDLIEELLRQQEPQLSFHGVRAMRGKWLRAEPVAALYEKGKVRHVGEFPLLEEEMITYRPGAANSPDRLDALVWALTELESGNRRFILA